MALLILNTLLHILFTLSFTHATRDLLKSMPSRMSKWVWPHLNTTLFLSIHSLFPEPILYCDWYPVPSFLFSCNAPVLDRRIFMKTLIYSYRSTLNLPLRVSLVNWTKSSPSLPSLHSCTAITHFWFTLFHATLHVYICSKLSSSV